MVVVEDMQEGLVDLELEEQLAVVLQQAVQVEELVLVLLGPLLARLSAAQPA